MVTSKDDPIANNDSLGTVHHYVSNPNVVAVETKAGGHLGWNHVTGNIPFGSLGKNFTDKIAETFIEALLSLERAAPRSAHRLNNDGADSQDSSRLRSKL